MSDRPLLLEEMADLLRAAGYYVRPPVDMLAAGPWEARTKHGCRHRRWLGTQSLAAYIGPKGALKVDAHRDTGQVTYTWRVSSFGRKRRDYVTTTEGTAKGEEAAMKAADKALLELLRELRRERVGDPSLTAAPSPKTQDIIGLDVPPEKT
jgi:hypothetical protein